jgi:glycosyltransferase involved in cell wall biosynthesis
MLPGDGRAASNRATAISWRLWQRDFFRAARAGGAAHPPDLIYARNAWFAWPYAALARTLEAPLFLEVNAVLSVEKQAYGEAAFAGTARRIEREAFRTAARILPVSAELARQAEAMGADPARIAVTPNAVDAELFAPPPAGPEHAPGRWVVGAACSMRAYHGMGTLLEAAARLREAIPGLRLLLIGGGPMLNELTKQAGELGIAGIVEFAGVTAHEDVARRLRECDACVCPNEGEANQYNCPMKIFEYMAMRIPVVASRWGDIPNIVDDGGTGMLHAPGDPDSLAAALLRTYREPEAARRRAEAARAEMQPRTWRAIARQAIEWAAAERRG